MYDTHRRGGQLTRHEMLEEAEIRFCLRRERELPLRPAARPCSPICREATSSDSVSRMRRPSAPGSFAGTEVSVDAVFDDLGRAADGGGDDRDAGGEGLQGDVGEALGVRRDGQQVEMGQ